MKDFIISLTLANMFYMGVWERFFYKGKFNVRYLPTVNSYLALIVGEILVALAVWGGIMLARRINNKILQKIAKFIFCLIAIYYLYTIARVLEDYISLVLIQLVFLVSVIPLIYYRKITNALVKILLVCSPFVLIIFGQAAMGIVDDWGKSHAIQTSSYFAAREKTPRILWIIFDEADQRIMYDLRPPKFTLPALDRFRQEAFFAENAYPPGGETALSMPSIIDGRIVANFKECDDWLEITYRGSKKPEKWGSQPNIFSEAKSLKMNSAVFGYLPYAKAIQKDVMSCGWSSGTYDYGSPDDTFLANLGSQFYGILNLSGLDYIQHRRAYREIYDAARHLVADHRYQLVLIHLDVPHLPSVGRSRSRTPRDYDENLLVMDRTFAELRGIMEHNGLWDDTTVIVSSDHWLRTKRYIRDRRIDHRVPFILKLAGRKGNTVYKPAFNTLLTHDLILALLRKEVITKEDLMKWFEEHRRMYPINTQITAVNGL